MLMLLTKIDPTFNSLPDTGATDRANLPQWLHVIADLFRCYQETPDLAETSFTMEQVDALNQVGFWPDDCNVSLS